MKLLVTAEVLMHQLKSQRRANLIIHNVRFSAAQALRILQQTY